MDSSSVHSRSGFRFSLKTLLLAVVPISIGLTGLRNSTTAWTAAIVSLTLCGWFAAIIAANFDARCRRPMWFGFAICCGGYFLAIDLSADQIVAILATERANAFLLDKFHPGEEYPPPIYPWPRPFVTGGIPAVESASHQAVDDRTTKMQPNGCVALLSLLSRSSAAYFLELTTVDAAPAESTSPAPTAPAANASSSVSTDSPADGPPTPDESADSDGEEIGERFMEIARCLWAWLFGSLGACFARFLTNRHGETAVDSNSGATDSPGEVVSLSRMRRKSAVGLRAVLLCSVVIAGICALFHPSVLCASVALSGTAIISLGLTVCALFGGARGRAFRSGFAVCCGGYFLLYSFGNPDADATSGGGGSGLNWFMTSAGTSVSLYSLHDAMNPESNLKLVPEGQSHPVTGGALPVVGFDSTGETGKMVAKSEIQSPENASIANRPNQLWQVGDEREYEKFRLAENRAGEFLQIGQSIWALVFGLLGGFFAWYLTWRQYRERPTASPTVIAARRVAEEGRFDDAS